MADAPPNRAVAVALLTAASASGPEALTLAAQLGGVAPCEVCGFVKQHCRCPAIPASEPTDRTPKDYAIEHAEYMAKDAERLIAAVNDLALAESEREDGTENPSDVDAAQETVSEASRALSCGIYEFRKRRDRASSAGTPHGAREPEVARAFANWLLNSHRHELINKANLHKWWAEFCKEWQAREPSEDAKDAARVPITTEQQRILSFLYGVGEIDGFGFGDHPPGERGLYWWRKHLLAAFPSVNDFGIGQSAKEKQS